MRSPSNDLYEFGPCRLDADQRVLTREHQRVPLAPKTFDLLLLLVRSPGRAFSKQELMTALWPGTFVEDANLSFQISTLRGNWDGLRVDRNLRARVRFAAGVVHATPSTALCRLARPAGGGLRAQPQSVEITTGLIVGHASSRGY